MDIKLIHPIDKFESWMKNVSQMFGTNEHTYQRFGLPGHNAIDYVAHGSKRGYGTKIFAAHDGIVDRITYDVPHRTKGKGISITSKDGKYSTIYWHLSDYDVYVKEKVKQGDVIGKMGNTGFVHPKPTKRNPYAGTHLHFGLKISGLSNPYQGYVDPTQYLPDGKYPIWFKRNLMIGSSGNDVSWLQTMLKVLGYAPDYEPIGYFGRKTLRDVRQLQRDAKISPALGFVGPKTRIFLHEKLNGRANT